VIFAVPGRVTDKYSQGCNNLIKTKKANVLTSAADLVYILNWDIQRIQTHFTKQLFVTAVMTKTRKYTLPPKTGKGGHFALRCDFPIYKISGMLLNMELKGVIRPLPSKLFETI
jgi:DNA processing protein